MASLPLTFVLLVGCGGGDSSGSGAEANPSRHGHSQSVATPGASAKASPSFNPAAMSAAEVLAQGLATVRSHEAEHFRWELEHSREQVLSINGEWTAGSGVGLATVDRYSHEDGSSQLGLVRVEDRVFVQTGRSCFVDTAAAERARGGAADSTALFVHPQELLTSLRPVSFDLSSLEVHATLPLRDAAPLLVLGSAELGGVVDASGLHGSVPVTVSIDAAGPIDTVSISSDDLRDQIGDLDGAPPELMSFVSSFDELVFIDGGAQGPQSAPPTAELADGPGEGCDAGRP